MSDWLRDPEEIYRRSFATIRAEADLAAVAEPLRPLVVRMIHACGMVDLAHDVRGEGDVVRTVRDALADGAPVLVDARMVAAGFLVDHLPKPARVICDIGEPGVAAHARAAGTTRSAALVSHWQDRLQGAVVVIGNAPTCLFQLLDQLAGGGPRPSAIIATPVGFIGAAESKQALVDAALGIPYVTVLGRRGGSALAAAAFNACLVGAA
ncbi:MAG TPA: precorrin-8X methylmutase [Geminicoccus sp.]|jgi:precorrin-8X/cobalt-precorrin-8 methylmutase|uniref:precorrin-8X methylmutase n=1 Tax=Geminicoccus sp. TaxID=2024832 RepID=UPI002E2F4AD2|nr:precorrin-8X methylmutase [Geminicoccus sp.]HEX2525711.1 precorrin-8X methylmutase [Geminicoccus sp.]